MIFKANFDKELIVMFLIMPLITVMFLSSQGEFKWVEYVAIFILFYIIVFVLILYILSIRYELTNDSIVIKTLFINRYIPYNKIDEVVKRYAKWTMEAPSYKQLWLMHKGKPLAVVSPTEFEKFWNCLESNLKLML